MNKIMLLAILSLVLISGCYQCPHTVCPTCYCNCPSCEPDTRPITKFECPDNIKLFHDGYLITEKVISDYSTEIFNLRITNYNKNKSIEKICIEHKFDDVDIAVLTDVPIPENYIAQNPDYRVKCWNLVIEYLNRFESVLLIEQGINVNQTVKISIWGNEE